ncbi:T9SS type A sorting domain-containing protein [Fulvivirga sp. M361]|uniref:T9SS type A sorting domain-containing protein n=1 Tax=Fulvivirga sp. M361 TaxID=2594266 RepID=UPI0011799C7D|nr:T9SS type A sorting domain-containing protein [Fulvivirga sp. M361]TRX60022.1 T9SS type A sorting domain-containing protein [Fulvivirga sp. M361]
MRVVISCFVVLIFVFTTHAQTCETVDDFKITVMGSSVALGVGGSGFGYARRYSDLLEKRFDEGNVNEWKMANISIGGNNTLNILNRWSEDLLPECGRYVMYGLSLANEGIQSGGQAKFDQFRDNMLSLIAMVREEGIEPVIVGNYTRGNFSPTDYDFIKEINMLIHGWDVASVNVLGAVDNGFGQWANGHSADAGHPNQAGHREFSFTIVPSLFDALHAGKAQPVWVEGTSMNLGRAASSDQLVITPEEILHPFTLSFAIKTTSTGAIAVFETDQEEPGSITIDRTTGTLNYTSPAGEVIKGNEVINDGQWHRITLTHYYAWGKTFLYADDVREGEVDEKLAPTTFYISDKNGPDDVLFRNLLFYRSGMNATEIEALNEGKMLKSSLEIYSPLDEEGVFSEDELINLAQSTNKLKKRDALSLLPLSIEDDMNGLGVEVYPNPARRNVTFRYTVPRAGQVTLKIYDLNGRMVSSLENSQKAGWNTYEWDLSGPEYSLLKSGIYSYRISSSQESHTGRLIIQ